MYDELFLPTGLYRAFVVCPVYIEWHCKLNYFLCWNGKHVLTSYTLEFIVSNLLLVVGGSKMRWTWDESRKMIELWVAFICEEADSTKLFHIWNQWGAVMRSNSLAVSLRFILKHKREEDKIENIINNGENRSHNNYMDELQFNNLK